MEASDTEIDAFVASMELSAEETEYLTEYIKGNREEFDNHTLALKENE
jgi:hypothetical protein